MRRPKSMTSEVSQLIRDGLYETLYLCAKDTRVLPWFFVLSIVVDFFQLLVFPLELIFQVTEEHSTSGLNGLLGSFLSWLSFSRKAIERLGEGFWVFIYVITLVWVTVLVAMESVHASNQSETSPCLTRPHNPTIYPLYST
eukprot:gb/GECG01007631.1/.p1 GENE.gb/GECG01007631.1/~~gb/GECG01007631.1/.p1  ORF type:complete len:141 (+),score=3.07 gb/GECG01007631.1/:1-423(+)